MAVEDVEGTDDPQYNEFLDSVEGEIALFRAVIHARPVGIHRHFHALTIRNSIYADTGHSLPAGDIWKKLATCYDLDVLEGLEVDGYAPPGESSSSSPSAPVRSPSPSENLAIHPFFRHEYALPSDPFIESLISDRRMRGTASLPSTPPAHSPVLNTKMTRGTRKGRSKLKNTGLVGGDSDSSALTQESGDESVMPTPRESNAGGTDAGTEYAEDEDVEMQEQSPGKAPSATSKATRRGAKGSRRGSGSSRARGGSTAGGRGARRKKKG